MGDEAEDGPDLEPIMDIAEELHTHDVACVHGDFDHPDLLRQNARPAVVNKA